MLDVIVNLLGTACDCAIPLVISFFKRRSIRRNALYKTDDHLFNMFKMPVLHSIIIGLHNYYYSILYGVEVI
jgi:hypothetical protein